MAPAALALTLLGLLRAALSGFERGAQRFAQLLHPTRETDPLERQIRHGAYLAMARVWLVLVMVLVPALLVAIVAAIIVGSTG